MYLVSYTIHHKHTLSDSCIFRSKQEGIDFLKKIVNEYQLTPTFTKEHEKYIVDGCIEIHLKIKELIYLP